jgi:hypothetical protein
MGLDAAEAFQAIDHWLVEGQQGDLLDLSVEFLPARELVLEQTEVLREDEGGLRARVASWRSGS